jgi:hypothetical protein
MFIHVQRETGLAHRTMVLRPWQVQALRLVASKWFAAVLTVAIVSWAYFAFQTARVPFLTRRITHLEQDAAKIDTLQATLDQLQRRYTQVQQMLSASARSATPASPARETKPAAAERKVPANAPAPDSTKAPPAKAPPAKASPAKASPAKASPVTAPLTKTPPDTAPANAATNLPVIAFFTTERTENRGGTRSRTKARVEDFASRNIRRGFGSS